MSMNEKEQIEERVEELIKERIQDSRYGCTSSAEEHLSWYLNGLEDAGISKERTEQIREFYYSESTERILVEERKNLQEN
jgi:hypothetical protein